MSRLIELAYSSPRLARLLERGRANANLKETKRFVKFALVGALGTVVDFSVLNIGILGLGLGKALANTFSFSAATLSNFTWNRLWTFPESREQRLRIQLPQFFTVNLIGYFINQAIFLGLDHLYFSRWGVLGYNVSKAIAIVIVLFWNFGVNRMWTYGGIE